MARVVHWRMAKAPTRRSFLQAAPLAAVALPLSGSLLHAAPLPFEALQTSPVMPTPVRFEVFSSQTMETTAHTLQAKPGVKEFVSAKELALLMNVTVEEKKAAAEFEIHEHRDHIFQILEGSTRYEVGGTPTTPHQTKLGEWLAPSSAGFTTVTLNRGDFLSVPRGTPHRRITNKQVTFILITGTSPS